MCMYTPPTSTSASTSASRSPAHQVVIKVSDEAGGIARSQLADVWMYNSWRLRGGGTGMGLPLARLYAMYFGGSLQLFPMEGGGGMALSAHPGSARLGSARARLLRLLRARPAALGGSTLPGEAITPLGDLPPPRVLERVAYQGHRFHRLLTNQATVPMPTRRSTAWATPTRSTASTRPSWPAMRTASRPRRCVTMPPLRRGPSRAMAPCRDAGVRRACLRVHMHDASMTCDCGTGSTQEKVVCYPSHRCACGPCRANVAAAVCKPTRGLSPHHNPDDTEQETPSR